MSLCQKLVVVKVCLDLAKQDRGTYKTKGKHTFLYVMHVEDRRCETGAVVRFNRLYQRSTVARVQGLPPRGH